MSFLAGDPLTAALLNAFLSNNSQYNEVLTSETSVATAYADLTTVGPVCTITSSGTRALVLFQCSAFTNSATNNGHFMSFAISGATTLAAADSNARVDTSTNAGDGFSLVGFAFPTINPGTNTFTAKYRCSTATASTFRFRRMLVLAP